MSWLKTLIKTSVNVLLPPRCPVSGTVVDAPGMLCSDAWASLLFIAPPYCAQCGVPFEFDLSERGAVLKKEQQEMMCAACLASAKPYSRARSALVYDEGSRHLILAFKHGDQTHLTLSFGPWLCSCGTEILAGADALIPVPLHWMRLIKRRYNQSALLGEDLRRRTGIPHWPDALHRQRNTPTQGHQNTADRRANVQGAFSLNPVYQDRICGKNLVLLDDVLTTGATAEECARILLKEGARQVDVLTIARVVKN